MKPAARTALRWVMLAALLAAALVVALWSPGGRDGASGDPGGGSGTEGASASPAPPPLAQLRASAALQPCPAPTPGTTASGPLAGVVLPCLGAPGEIDLGAALAGRPALVNLWGPLCAPCADELPALAAYAAEPGAVPVLGVEVQQMPEGALSMLADLDVHLPSVSDPQGRLRAALGSPPVLPLTYLVSRDGRVSQVNPPEVLRSPEQVRAVVERYLGPDAAG